MYKNKLVGSKRKATYHGIRERGTKEIYQVRGFDIKQTALVL